MYCDTFIAHFIRMYNEEEKKNEWRDNFYLGGFRVLFVLLLRTIFFFFFLNGTITHTGNMIKILNECVL